MVEEQSRELSEHLAFWCLCSEKAGTMVIVENYRLLDGEDGEELPGMDRHLKAHIRVFVSQLWANI